MKKYNNINLILAVIMFAITLVSMFFLPNKVPIHTDYNKVDRWGSKYTYFIAPMIAFILWYMMPKFMSRKNDQAKILGGKVGELYLIKNKIMINVLFLAFVGLDLYWIYQDFLLTSKSISLNFFLLIAVAILYITASFTVFYMDDKELLKLHWKEFTPADSSIAIRKRKILFLVFGCIAAMLILADALYSTASVAVIAVLAILLILKFLIGPLKAKLHIGNFQ